MTTFAYASSSTGIGNCVGYDSPDNLFSFLPHYSSTTCGDTNGAGTISANSSVGHVGAEGTATSYTNEGSLSFLVLQAGGNTQDANYVFEPLDGGPLGLPIDVSFYLTFNGSGSANETSHWKVAALAQVNSTFVLNVSEGSRPEDNVQAIGGFVGSHLTTTSFQVITGQPYSIYLSLSLETSTAGATSDGTPGQAQANFSNSLDFPLGVAVFQLPDGYTVNNPEAYLFNNRFIPPRVATTPLPSGIILFGTGVGTLGLLGRRRKRKVVAAPLAFSNSGYAVG